ncbi:MAG: TRAP transporter small permease subunit [bacterium]|nr:TRAP transporter small permease subunit [bacterium]
MATEDGPSPRGVNAALDRIGDAISWIWIALIAVIVSAVVLRFVFGVGLIQLEELQWHLYAVGFLAGIVGCVVHDRHVRVDVLRERMRPRTRDWIDFYGVLLFQLPLVVLVLWSAAPFVAESFRAGEESASAGGLPYRWLLKAVLPLAFAALGVATLTRLRRLYRSLFPETDA